MKTRKTIFTICLMLGPALALLAQDLSPGDEFPLDTVRKFEDRMVHMFTQKKS